MAAQQPILVRFVPQTTPGQTRREYELELANRRSHAAKVAHLRKTQLHGRYVHQREKHPIAQKERILLNSESSKLYLKAEELVAGGNSSIWRLLVSLPEIADEDGIVNLGRLSDLLSSRESVKSAPGGNSDAFDCYAISITSRVNQVLSFARDEGIPGLFFTPFFRRISSPISKPTVLESSNILSSPSAVLNWKLTSEALTNQGAAMALVSSNIMLMCLFLSPPAVQYFREIAMRMMLQSMFLLRNEISQVTVTKEAPEKASKLLILQIYWLYRAESNARNFTAAAIHEKMLYRFIKELDDQDVEFKYYMYLCMLFWGVDTTINTMKKGACNPGPYSLRIAATLQRLAAPDLGYLPIDYKHPHYVIQAEPLRSILVRSRRLTTLMENPLPAGNFLDTLTLLESYLDTLEANNPYSLETSGQKYLHAGVGLTIVLVSRTLFDITSINGVNMRDASRVLHPRLRSVSELALLTMTPSERTFYQELQLWIFYIGALYEQRLLHQRTELVETWFSDLLATEARKQYVVSWQSMKELLQRFLFSEFMEPHGELWFESWLEIGNFRLVEPGLK